MKTVLVLGAAGSIGHSTSQAFLDHGWRVLGLVRQSGETRLPKGVQPVTADLFKPADLIQVCGKVDIVFNGLNVPYTQWRDEARRLHIAALAVAEAFQARHIFPGNVYNFGKNMPPELWPSTRQVPTTRKGRIRVEIEDIFRQAAARGGVQTLILRAGDFFGGASQTSWMTLLVGKSLKKNDRLVAPGAKDRIHAWAFLPDLAQTFVKLAACEAQLTPFDEFHFEGHSVTLAEMARAASEAKGRKVTISQFPRWLFSLLAVFDTQIGEALEMLYLWDVPHALKDDRLARVIGQVPSTSLTSAIASLLS